MDLLAGRDMSPHKTLGGDMSSRKGFRKYIVAETFGGDDFSFLAGTCGARSHFSGQTLSSVAPTFGGDLSPPKVYLINQKRSPNR